MTAVRTIGLPSPMAPAVTTRTFLPAEVFWRNLWRMMQFFETYRGQPKLATLLRKLSWSHNLAIMSRGKRDEERELYLRMAARERWSFRELQRQLNSALFERTVLSPTKLSAPLREMGKTRAGEAAQRGPV